jgi:hypothetical protein
LNNLVVRNSSGPGILLWKGGVRGTNWETSENGASGVDFREFHPDVNAIQSMNNSGHGVSVRDSSNVELEYIVTSGNGVGSLSANLGSGFYFDESNDVVSGGKNVSCYVCTSIDDNYGITVEDSIDLQLDTLTIINSINSPAFSADNSGLSQNGNIIINDILIYSNSTDPDSYAIELNDVDAEI